MSGRDPPRLPRGPLRRYDLLRLLSSRVRTLFTERYSVLRLDVWAGGRGHRGHYGRRQKMKPPVF